MTKRLTIALIALLALSMIAVLPVAAANVISAGDTVFRGEAGINIQKANNETTALAQRANLPNGATLSWFAAGSDPFTASPQATMVVSDPTNFFVDPSMNLGAWYYRAGGFVNTTIVVADPHLAISVWDSTTPNRVDRTDGSVLRLSEDNIGLPQSRLVFRIVSNLDAMATQRGFIYPANLTIRVGTPDGNVFNSLVNASGQVIQLTPGNPLDSVRNTTAIRSNPWWVHSNASTQTGDIWDVSKPHYPRGTYTFWATVNVNSMNDNYNVVGKTKTTTHTIELIDEDTILTANKDTVIRGNDFALTITGRPNTDYVLWVKGSAGETNITVPRVKAGQQGVRPIGNDNTANGVALNYFWKTGANNQVRDDIPTPASGPVTGIAVREHDGTFTSPYANVTLNSAGVRTVQFLTNESTKDKTWTFRVQRIDQNNPAVAGQTVNDDYDEVKVKIEKGAVTITASGDRTYYLGQEVTLSGTNTDSANTFLFITGPNLESNGVKLDAPQTESVNDDEATFVKRTVKGDDTWDYKWRTGEAMIDPGTYTIYAVSQAKNKGALTDVKYATVSIVIRKGFITATPSATTVAKGDKLIVRGTAEGEPDNIQMWIFGVNKYIHATQNVEDDATFEYEITGATTKDLAAGQYFVVAQHPMANRQFDVRQWIETANTDIWVATDTKIATAAFDFGAESFKVVGNQRLQGSDAAEALTRMLDLQSIDDTYTKLTFLVEEPWIRVDTVGDKYVGTQFKITGTTNLAVDNELIIEVTSSSFRPTDKTASGEFSGQSAVVKVVRGDAGYNTWSMDVDASGFLPDEYIVKVESIEAEASTTTTFNVLEGVPVTPAPATPVPGTPVPATPVPTQPPATPASPGFGALVAIAGLGAVAFLVLRRD